MTFLQWLATWLCWGLGDLLSRLPRYPYRLYNWLMVTSNDIQGSRISGKWWPWWKSCDGMEDGKNYVLGYMCGVDWEHEIGMASGGNTIYASPEDCARCRRCTTECGIVEVRVYLNKWVVEQNLWGEEEDNGLSK